MNAQEEREFDIKTEKYFQGHRPAPDGRNFMAFRPREYTKNTKEYNKNFDRTFPNAPGAGI